MPWAGRKGRQKLTAKVHKTFPGKENITYLDCEVGTQLYLFLKTQTIHLVSSSVHKLSLEITHFLHWKSKLPVHTEVNGEQMTASWGV